MFSCAEIAHFTEMLKIVYIIAYKSIFHYSLKTNPEQPSWNLGAATPEVLMNAGRSCLSRLTGLIYSEMRLWARMKGRAELFIQSLEPASSRAPGKLVLTAKVSS